MPEFKKILTESEITSGFLRWEKKQEDLIRKVIPHTLVFDLIIDGKRFDHLTVDWEKCELYIGEPLLTAPSDSEIVLSCNDKNGTVVQAKIITPAERMIIRKRLSLDELKHRRLKWYAREDDIYRRLFAQIQSFSIKIQNTVIPNRSVDFEKRVILIGEALKAFSPGDILLIHRATDESTPTIVISKEQQRHDVSVDAMTCLRALITKLLSRPLNEFNEGEVKSLIALLDENKRLWEKIVALKEENEKLKEQVATLENVFEQFAKNTFFTCKRDFEDWVSSHMTLFEKGIRVLYRDYAIVGEDGKKRRIDLLAQDRKGVLVAVEIAFNPSLDSIEAFLKTMNWLSENLDLLGKELTQGRLTANNLRTMVIANQEKPELVEFCLKNAIKLCVVNGGMVIDVIE